MIMGECLFFYLHYVKSNSNMLKYSGVSGVVFCKTFDHQDSPFVHFLASIHSLMILVTTANVSLLVMMVMKLLRLL